MPTPERWAQITELFHQALECATGARARFLEEVCGEDLSLMREVESLLAEHDREGISLKTGPPLLGLETVIDQTEDQREPLDLVGKVVGGKYQIDALLGKGGMGAVYKARQMDLDRTVAIKVVLTELLGNRKAVARFKHEAVAVGRLRHPHIVTVYDFGMDASVGAFLVMEFLVGRSLRDEIRAARQLSVAQALGVMMPACAALKAAHEAGVIHRDLKPDNFFLTEVGQERTLKVLDFGIAKLVGGHETAGLTRAGALIGTPSYMAPEQIEGHEIDGRADVYSLGCVLYEMLVGRPPFVAASIVAITHKHVHERPVEPGKIRNGIPPRLDRVVMRALAKRPDERFADPEDLWKAAEQAGFETGPGVGLVTIAGEDQIDTDISDLVRETAEPNNLPEQMTGFVGRESQVAAILATLERNRLMTLTGPGGMGKTRLALKVASESGRRHKDGIWLVELAGLREAELVVGAVAAVLGVREQGGGDLLDAVVASVRDKHILVILDNCEHLIDACARVAAALIRGSRNVHVLSTSREALGIAGEIVWAVPSLSMPSGRADMECDQALESEAVRLFVGRAELMRPGFNLNPTNARAIGELCRRLEGMPLAIELAAARVKVLSVEQILLRMQDRFRLLAGGARSAPTRHQTLRATLDWSYDLLTLDERLLLERLAVFAGGWDLATAEAVCSGEGIDELAVLDLLTRLVDKSLVVVDESANETRYRMLEMVREYAVERLATRGADVTIRRRHAMHFLDLVERVELELRTGNAGRWLNVLETEYGNLQAALGWLLDVDSVACLRLCIAIQGLWRDRGHLTEARRWLAQALDASRDAPPTLRARALRGAGEFARRQGDMAAATVYWEESVAIAHDLGDALQLAWSSYGLGNLAMGRGDLDAARTCFEESLAAGRQIGNDRVIADSLNTLGEVARHERNWLAARDLYAEALAASKRVGNQRGICIALSNLGAANYQIDDLAAARTCYLESLSMEAGLGNIDDISYSLEGMAAVSSKAGASDRAARLLGGAEALRASVGAEMEPIDRAFRDGILDSLRGLMSDAELDAALSAGRTLSLDAMLALAMDDP